MALLIEGPSFPRRRRRRAEPDDSDTISELSTPPTSHERPSRAGVRAWALLGIFVLFTAILVFGGAAAWLKGEAEAIDFAKWADDRVFILAIIGSIFYFPTTTAKMVWGVVKQLWTTMRGR